MALADARERAAVLAAAERAQLRILFWSEPSAGIEAEKLAPAQT